MSANDSPKHGAYSPNAIAPKLAFGPNGPLYIQQMHQASEEHRRREEMRRDAYDMVRRAATNNGGYGPSGFIDANLVFDMLITFAMEQAQRDKESISKQVQVAMQEAQAYLKNRIRNLELDLIVIRSQQAPKSRPNRVPDTDGRLFKEDAGCDTLSNPDIA